MLYVLWYERKWYWIIYSKNSVTIKRFVCLMHWVLLALGTAFDCGATIYQVFSRIYEQWTYGNSWANRKTTCWCLVQFKCIWRFVYSQVQSRLFTTRDFMNRDRLIISRVCLLVSTISFFSYFRSSCRASISVFPCAALIGPWQQIKYSCVTSMCVHSHYIRYFLMFW